jgi:nucleotide-binding universal stress UspA family protein
MKILLAVDGSPYTKKMLAYLAAHPEFLVEATSVTAFTVQPPLPPRARAAVGKAEVDAFQSEEASKVLDPVIRFLRRKGFKPAAGWKVGPAGETIAKFAESGKFDLIIMGSHGSNALRNLVMGSVATKVLANCKVPVLLVR